MKISLNDIEKNSRVEKLILDCRVHVHVINYNINDAKSKIIDGLNNAIVHKYDIYNECVEIVKKIYYTYMCHNIYGKIAIYYLDLPIVVFHNTSFVDDCFCFIIDLDVLMKKMKRGTRKK